MTICMDVTEMLKTNYISGIQRVVKEITVRWIEQEIDLLLLSYNLEEKLFYVIDNKKYYDFYTGRSDEECLLTCSQMRISDFNRKYVFFDLDSIWNNPLKRSYLLPKLKKRGTKIAAHIYDTIPVTETQFCHGVTVIDFMEWFGAQLKYADLILSNAQATVDSIKNIIAHTDVKRVNAKVIRLGCDFKEACASQEYREIVRKIPHMGKYILMVGTIEPRKNHAFVLDAFDQRLFKENVNLVFAGRTGWNVEGLVRRIKNHPEFQKKLYFIEDALDEEIVYLYKNALAVAFPSYNEGYGLPVIEALNYGTLVLAADIPVLREVGGDFCRYFSLEKADDFINAVLLYDKNEEIYQKEKQRLNGFPIVTWEECAKEMYGALKYVSGPMKIYNRIRSFFTQKEAGE